jgi:hypothetical protein
MTAFRTRLLALRELGLPALLRYASYRLRLGTGLIRLRTRAVEWQDGPIAPWLRREVSRDPADYATYRAGALEAHFFFEAPAADLPWPAKGSAPEALMREADEIIAGRFRLFGGPPVDLGYPPDWFAFPPPLADRPRLGPNRHWSDVRLDEPGADVRLVWELSRFGWVFPLARAYRWTGETWYAEACWQLVDSWRRANPPNAGVHWASAQEVALRILALAFAERAFFPEWSRHPKRLQTVTQLVASHAARIPPTLDYARAQENNHLLSEAAGLYTAGLLFPELREATRWRALGRRLLEHGFERQVFPDGGYIQHSANYQRLALGLGVWCARLGELNREPFSSPTLAAISRLARSLAAQSDLETGRTPSFGPDDGSDILPLSTVEARDVRPIAAAAARLTLGESWYPPGPWDETSHWLGLAEGVRSVPPRAESLMDTGLHYLDGKRTRACLRCVEFHERPGHSDQLHVDLWSKGRLLTFDPGSYLYNGLPPWHDGLAGTAAHNAPLVDAEEPMQRAGRFLWVGRAQGRLEGRTQEYRVRGMRAAHDGYRRHGVRTSRTVSLFEEVAWLVKDVASYETSPGALGAPRRLTVGWNLPDVRWEWRADELRLSGEGGPWLGWDGCFQFQVRAGLARAGVWIAGDPVDGPVSLWGWASPRYSALEPCLRLVLEVSGNLPLCLRTRFSPGGGWPKSLVNEWDVFYPYLY